eukprot:RCo036121
METTSSAASTKGALGELLADILDQHTPWPELAPKVNELKELLQAKPENLEVFCRDHLKGTAGQEVCSGLCVAMKAIELPMACRRNCAVALGMIAQSIGGRQNLSADAAHVAVLRELLVDPESAETLKAGCSVLHLFLEGPAHRDSAAVLVQ